MVGLYFWSSTFKSCSEFTPKLIEIYKELNRRGEKFEIVLIALHEDEQSFNESLKNMPWLALPFNDKSRDRLSWYFDLHMFPTLAVIGADGKTLLSNAFDVIDDHGIRAYPFTPEKMAELAEIEKARHESQTLDSFLVHGEQDFVVGKDGLKVPVADLVGKHIFLYFSSKCCPPCRAFLPELIEAYHQIKSRDNAFEVILISCDDEQDSYDELFAQMPWLALPYGDERKQSLRRYFKVYWIPRLVAIGPTGKTITKDAKELIMAYGSSVYPFGEEQIRAMEEKDEEMAKGWPRKLSYHPLHEEHELLLLRRASYQCDGCKQGIQIWAYCCKECDFDLHPKCALEGRKEGGGEDGDGGGLKQPSKDGWVCDGEVCYKA